MLQSTYLKTADANWIKKIAYPSAPTIRLSLHSGNPSLTGANEIALTRITPTSFSAIATVDNLRQFSVDEIITFTNPLSDGTATYFGAWDATTGGNFLGGGRIVDGFGNPTVISFTIGNDIIIPANSIYFACNRGIFSDYFIDAKLNYLKGTPFLSVPSDIYIGVGRDLLANGGGTDSGLAREVMTWGALLTITNYIRIQSALALDYGVSPSDLLLNTLAFYDALSGGNQLAIATFAEQLYMTGSSISWAVGTINMEF